nr:hypothetical protein [Tanacetum cinerariifolium]
MAPLGPYKYQITYQWIMEKITSRNDSGRWIMEKSTSRNDSGRDMIEAIISAVKITEDIFIRSGTVRTNTAHVYRICCCRLAA